MIVYNYDDRGVYLGSSVADHDPLEIGRWLIPAKATEQLPPAPQDNMERVFVNGSWRLVPVAADIPVEEQIGSEDETPEQMLSRFQSAHDNHLNAAARSKKYDSIHTAALRAGYPGPYQAEGIAFAQWMDACNASGYQILSEVQARTRQIPASTQEYIAMLPVLVLP